MERDVLREWSWENEIASKERGRRWERMWLPMKPGLNPRKALDCEWHYRAWPALNQGSWAFTLSSPTQSLAMSNCMCWGVGTGVSLGASWQAGCINPEWVSGKGCRCEPSATAPAATGVPPWGWHRESQRDLGHTCFRQWTGNWTDTGFFINKLISCKWICEGLFFGGGQLWKSTGYRTF